MVSGFVDREEHIIPAPWKITPAHGALFIHRQGVSVHPEAIERHVAAKLVSALVFARLYAICNFSVSRSLLAKVSADYCRELLLTSEYRKVQLGKEVSRKNDLSMRIY